MMAGGRQQGKSFSQIVDSHYNGTVIIVQSEDRKRQIEKTAFKHGYSPTVKTMDELTKL